VLRTGGDDWLALTQPECPTARLPSRELFVCLMDNNRGIKLSKRLL
jgi:hypothetical protein